MSDTPAHKQLVVIGGPTASGKTALAISLAKQWNTVIISADSRQFYKELSIGTAKPTREELATVPHYFVGHLAVTDTYTAADYEKEALEKIQHLFTIHDRVIATGGSGLFIQALTEGLDPAPPADPVLRERLAALLAAEGIQALQEQLLRKDAARYHQTDLYNPQRLIRAIEMAEHPLPAAPQKTIRTFDIIKFALNPPREELYRRINERVDLMLQQGLLEEVKSVYAFKDLNALQTVGYKELFDHLDGHSTLAQAAALIKQHTRNYAKRQLTWFRNRGNYILLEEPYEPAIEKYLAK